MIKIQDKPTLYVDVDDTLVMWSSHDVPETQKKDFIELPCGNSTTVLWPHRAHVNMIKQFRARGHNIVVWSQGGSDWAETVVKALKIEDLVDIIITKPNWFIDDLPSTVFLPDSNRIWIDPKSDRHSRIVRPDNSKLFSLENKTDPNRKRGEKNGA